MAPGYRRRAYESSGTVMARNAGVSRSAVASLVVALAVSGCGAGDDAPTLPGEPRPLHGSALIIAEHLEPVPDSVAWFTDDEAFHRYFERVGRLWLTEEVPFGMVDPPEVAHDGRMAFVDPFQRQAFLLDPSGQMIAELYPDACDPGYGWYPGRVRFYPDGTLLVHGTPNRPPLLFDAHGGCIQKLELVDRARAVAPGPDHSLFYFVHGGDAHRVMWYRSPMQAGKVLGESSDAVNFLRFFVIEALESDDNGRAYAVLPPDGAITAYDTTGAPGQVMADPPGYFRPMRADTPRGMNIVGMRDAGITTVDDASIPYAIRLLDYDRLVVQYVNNFADEHSRQGVHVVATDGTVLTTEPILLTFYRTDFSAADGLIYTLDWDHPNPDGPYGNPSLVVYRFLG